MTDTATETVPAATDNQHMAKHSFCTGCYPQMYMGMKALCGEPMLGIKAPPGGIECDPCLRAWIRPLPCGH